MLTNYWLQQHESVNPIVNFEDVEKFIVWGTNTLPRNPRGIRTTASSGHVIKMVDRYPDFSDSLSIQSAV